MNLQQSYQEMADSRQAQSAIGYINAAADYFGIPRDALTAIAYQESKFDPNAANPESTATGLFQHIDDTWSATVDRYGKTVGVTKASSRTDPYASSMMGAALAAENARALEKAGIPVTVETLYTAHFAGIGTAKKAYAADPNAKVSSVFSQKQIDANKSLLGVATVGQALANIEGKMAKGMQMATVAQGIASHIEDGTIGVPQAFAPTQVADLNYDPFSPPTLDPSQPPALANPIGIPSSVPSMPTVNPHEGMTSFKDAVSTFAGGTPTTGQIGVPTPSPEDRSGWHSVQNPTRAQELDPNVDIEGRSTSASPRATRRSPTRR